MGINIFEIYDDIKSKKLTRLIKGGKLVPCQKAFTEVELIEE